MHTRTTRRQFRLQRQTFSIWRPCWRPYWISRLAIIYANLCRQFQKLQTIGKILIYDTSCCTGGGGGGGVRVTPRKSGQFHSLSPYHYVFEQKNEKYQSFLSENFQVLEVKSSIYLNRRVNVMDTSKG